MHSSANRLQNAFGYFTTVTFVVALLVAISTVFYPPSPSATLRVNHVKVARGRPQYYTAKQQEYAIIDFDLDAELASLWNWNTKLVFLWVAVGYDAAGAAGGKWTDNELVIWDRIVTSRPKIGGSLKIRGQKAKYNINDISGRFAERNATVRVGWNVQPHVGWLYWGAIEGVQLVQERTAEELEEGSASLGGTSFQFPLVGAGRVKV